MSKKSLTILQLYPKDMNIYGDYGNVLVIQKRLEWYGYDVIVESYNPGDKFPESVDIIIGGGGQDSGQTIIQKDLLIIGPHIRQLADNGVPMLVVCGLYQLFGKFFQTISGSVLQGIGVFDAETYGKPERLIGNTIIESDDFGDILGYENHSGQTFLGAKVMPLGRVRLGAGNNLHDGNEGARYNNVIGTYLHGSVLPKNPKLADFLIEKAATRKFGDFSTDIIDDTFASKAREIAIKRPR